MRKSSKRPTKLSKAKQRAWDSLNLQIVQAAGKFPRLRRLKLITWKSEVGKSFFPEKVAPVVKVAKPKPTKPTKPQRDPAARSWCCSKPVIYNYTEQRYDPHPGRRHYYCRDCYGPVSVDGHRIQW